MAGEFRIQGLDGVLKKMRSLAPKLQKKGLTAALRKGARIVVKAARAGYAGIDDPDTKSNIGKAITSRADTKGGKRAGGAMVKVGVAGGARPKPGTEDEGHWRFVEFGKEGVPARPFLRPALENNVAQVTEEIVTQLNVQIDKIIGTA
jgi:HK97 gp10 family phage protein